MMLLPTSTVPQFCGEDPSLQVCVLFFVSFSVLHFSEMLCGWNRPNPLQLPIKSDKKHEGSLTEGPRRTMLACCYIPVPVVGKQPLYIRLYIRSPT